MLRARATAIGDNPENPVLTGTGRLYVVDFGCGTFAMQFGVALALADTLERGQTITNIRVDSMDTSRPMINMGERVWERFVDLAKQNQRLVRLPRAIEIMDCKVVKSSFGAKRSGEECWFSAMHVVYQENEDEVRKQLALRADKTDPDVGLITSHANQVSSELATAVSPFSGDSRYSHLAPPFGKVAPRFSDELELITEWRKSIRGRLLLKFPPGSLGLNYLHGQVTSG